MYFCSTTISLSISLTHLSDFFRGPTVSAVRLAGLEHVLHFTALDGKIYMRSYRYRNIELVLKIMFASVMGQSTGWVVEFWYEPATHIFFANIYSTERLLVMSLQVSVEEVRVPDAADRA